MPDGAVYTPLEMIEKLIAFDTVSRNSNLKLIGFVRDYLAAHGIESWLVPNQDGSKANLYATVGPRTTGGVVLSGHTDVVPVDGQPWDSDPFQLRDADGRYYGRGTCDMKSFSAIALALVPDMLSRGLNKPIHFALSYDEEVGCLGAPDMIAEIAANVPAPRAVIVGEPTNMEVVTAHKGINAFTTVVTGHEAHSSQMHRGVSAVMTAARLIGFLEDMMREGAAKADPESPFDPPYTTIHVGLVSGGTALNIISRECTFRWDLRTIPEDDPQDLADRFEAYCQQTMLPAMREIAPSCEIETVRGSVAPALKAEPNGEAEALCRLLTGHNASAAVAYGTEGGQFQEAGFSTVVCGPGSIDQAHQPNEFIEKSQVEASIAFTRKLIDLLAD